MAKNPNKGQNVVDFKQHADSKDLCIFIQRKLALSLAVRIKQIHEMLNIGILILIYLCVINTVTVVFQIKSYEPTNKTQTNNNQPVKKKVNKKPPLELIKVPNFPPIGY